MKVLTRRSFSDTLILVAILLLFLLLLAPNLVFARRSEGRGRFDIDDLVGRRLNIERRDFQLPDEIREKLRLTILKEICGDGRDNDLDGRVDEDDRDCILFEQIDGSVHHTHERRATAWGHCQHKIARYDDRVYMFVLHNDNYAAGVPTDKNHSAKFVVYMREDQPADPADPWRSIVDQILEEDPGSPIQSVFDLPAFNASTGGNVVMGEDGALHAFVFESTCADGQNYDRARGKLVHYTFPDAGMEGDLTTYSSESAIDNDSCSQVVNTRVGASVGYDTYGDEMLAVGFGMGNREYLSFKPGGEDWVHREIGAQEFERNFYYPYTLIRDDGRFSLFSVRHGNSDDPPDKLLYFECEDDGEECKDENPYLILIGTAGYEKIEQVDIYEDSVGDIHLLYREIDTGSSDKEFKHIVKSGGRWYGPEVLNYTTDDRGTDFIGLRVIGETEQDNEVVLYYLGIPAAVNVDSEADPPVKETREVYVKRGDDGRSVAIGFPPDEKMSIVRAYVAAPRGGSPFSSRYIDILLLCDDQDQYREGGNSANYYLRIDRDQLEVLVGAAR